MEYVSKGILNKALAVALSAILAFAFVGFSPSSAHAAAAPSKPKITKIVKLSKGFTVKWKKSSSKGKAFYQIRYCANKNMGAGAKIVRASKAATSKKIKSNVDAAKTYYVQVRLAYKSSGKTKFTKWSAKKSVTTMVGSGNASFDKKIESILSKNVKSTGAIGLKKAFKYVAKLRQGNSTTASRTGDWSKWSVKYAKDMANKGRGNCYQAASLMAWLAKGLGYDARVAYGTYTGGSGKMNPHGWAEVKVGGKWYILDPNNQNTADNAGIPFNYYKVSKSSATGKKYAEMMY